MQLVVVHYIKVDASSDITTRRQCQQHRLKDSRLAYLAQPECTLTHQHMFDCRMDHVRERDE